MQAPQQKKDWPFLVAVGVLSLLFHGLYFRYGVQNLVDLGVACVDSERLLLGQVPGRDFFEPYGPGRFYLIAWTFKLFGPSLLTFSSLCLVLLAVKDMLVFAAARLLLPRPWALYAAALTIVVHGPIHKVFLVLGSLLLLFFALWLVKKPNAKKAFLFGTAIFAAAMLRYDLGAIGILAAILLVVCQPRSPAATGIGRSALVRSLLAGLCLPGLAYGAYLFLAGADFPAWIEHHLIRLNSLEKANADLPGFLGLLQSDQPREYLFGGLLALALLLMAVSAGLAWRLRNKACPDDRLRALMLGVLLLIGVLLLNQVRLGLKFIRLSQVAPALYLLFAFLLWRTGQFLGVRPGLARLRPLIPATALAFFLGMVGYIWAFEGTWSQDSFAVYKLRPHYMDVDRGGCYFKGKKGQEIEEVVRFLQEKTAPGEPIFCGPTCPLFHFLADRPTASPFTDFTFYYFNEANQQAVIEALEKSDLTYGVQWPRPLTGFYFEACAPLLARYVETQFHRERTIGRFVIYKRKNR